MIKINFSNNKQINIIWQIFKCHSDNREDFSRADVHVLLVGTKNRIPLKVNTQQDGTLRCVVPSGISNDIYALKAIWRKNFNDGCLFEDYSHCEDFHHIHHRIGLCPYGWAVSEVDDIMYVTPYESEATTNDEEVNIKLKSEVATYGYDGLDAYELAVTRGCMTEEQKWLESYKDIINRLEVLEKAVRQILEKLEIDGPTIPDEPSLPDEPEQPELNEDIYYYGTTETAPTTASELTRSSKIVVNSEITIASGNKCEWIALPAGYSIKTWVDGVLKVDKTYKQGDQITKNGITYTIYHSTAKVSQTVSSIIKIKKI